MGERHVGPLFWEFFGGAWPGCPPPPATASDFVPSATFPSNAKETVHAKLKLNALTLARFPYYATFASAGGEGCDPPSVSKLSVVELGEISQRFALD